MVSIAPSLPDAKADARTERRTASRVGDMWLSAALCIVFPVTFWLFALAAVDRLAGLSVSAMIYVGAAVAMCAVLVPIWASLVGTKDR